MNINVSASAPWGRDVSLAALAMGVVCVVELALTSAASPDESLALCAYLVSWHLILGCILGVFVAGLRMMWRRHQSKNRRLKGRWKWLSLGITAVGLATAFGLWVYFAGIEVRALPWHILAPLIGFMGAFGIADRALPKREQKLGWRLIAIGTLSLSSLALLMAGAAVTQDPAIPGVLDRTVTSGWAVKHAQSYWDDDGDGFPTSFCVGGCDCDDTRAGINPGAKDVPDNGLDEDCDGADLKRPAQADIDALTTVKPQAPKEAVLAPKPEKKRKHYNVILIIVDALRADHLGLYGYTRNTSPQLDALSKHAAVFTQARAHGAMTRESLPAILTGRYYAETSRKDQQWPVFHDDNVMLAERFKASGYRTWGISSFIYVLPQYGFAQGFDHFDTEILKLRSKVHWNRTSDLVTERTVTQIDAWRNEEKKPFFVMAHYADPHAGFLRHPESPRFGGYTADKYDEEIFFTDLKIGELFKALKTRQLLDETYIILTADHGEGLRKEEDHGKLYHGQHLYDNLIHVPLIVWGPTVKPGRVDVPVGLVDIVPTAMELTGLKDHAKVPLSGVSLVPFLEGDPGASHPPVFAHKYRPRRAAKVAMVDWPYKVIWNVRRNTWELYDLRSDKNERKNLSRSMPEVKDRLMRKVKLWRSLVLKEVPGRAVKSR